MNIENRLISPILEVHYRSIVRLTYSNSFQCNGNPGCIYVISHLISCKHVRKKSIISTSVNCLYQYY